MKKQTTGIHHITAIARNAQENVDFYAGVLGIRLVKKRLTLTPLRCIIFTSAMKRAARAPL